MPRLAVDGVEKRHGVLGHGVSSLSTFPPQREAPGEEDTVWDRFVHVARLHACNAPPNARRRGASPNDLLPDIPHAGRPALLPALFLSPMV
jgi:hypothetical protein